VKTTPQKRWGRENERKKSYYVLPVAFLTKQTAGTEIHGGLLWVGFFFFSLFAQ